MTHKHQTQAVIYARVSTKKQAREGNGLDSQETRCREFAKFRGLKVVRVFTDDMSGSHTGRPGMLDMLSYLKKHQKEAMVVIIDDISRLARGIEAHLKLRAEIAHAGGVLQSPSIEFGEDSDSILVEHLLASVSQHQRQKNGEQAKNRMRARMLGGFWVFNAPIGYRYQRVPTGGAILVREEPIASIIGQGLEAFASGKIGSQAEFKRFLESHEGFPLCRHGFLTNEQANRILTRPIYAGYVESKCWGVSLREGQHEGVISLETFQKIQERLNGKPVTPARADINEDFPLRGFVACGCCNHPMTANWAKGRNKSYPYYVCRHRGCEKFGKSVARHQIDDVFEGYLREIAPDSEAVTALDTHLRAVWDDKHETQRDDRTAAKEAISGLEKKISGLLDRIVEAESPALIGAYERKLDELEREKLVLKEKVARCGTVVRHYDDIFQTAFSFLANPCSVWKKDGLEGKRTVLKLALEGPITWDWNEGVQTANLSLPFKVLQDKNQLKNVMAERVGFEPTVSVNPQRFSRPSQSTTLAPLRDDEGDPPGGGAGR